MTAAQIAHIIGGTVEGDLNASVSRGAPIEAAQEGEFTFLDNPKYEAYVYSTRASILLVNNKFQLEKPVTPTLVRTADVRTRSLFCSNTLMSLTIPTARVFLKKHLSILKQKSALGQKLGISQ